MTIPRISKKKLAKLNGKTPFSSITASRKARRANPKKKASNFKRQFHSVERVEFVKSLQCAACGVVGYSENAHLTPKSEKGTGYRGAYRFIAPLCRTYSRSLTVGNIYLSADVLGCHTMFDEHYSDFVKRFPDFNSEQAARQTEKLWQDHLTLSDSN